MNFGSLFSGIGGLDLGLERAGMTCAWQVENDDYATRVLAKHWPGVTRYGDIRTIGRDFECGCCGWPEPVDLIAGGFPCQDISVAGKGKGLAGERSGLWREFYRIVEEMRPPWVLIENVPALRTRGLRTVLSDLRASGYDAEWDGVSAAHVGAPHRRDRLFVVAYSQQQQLREQSRRRCRSDGSDPVLASISGQEGTTPNTDSEGQLQPRGRIFEGRGRPGDCDWWSTEPDVVRVVHGVPARVDRLRGLGNAVVPQVAEHIGRLIVRAAR